MRAIRNHFSWMWKSILVWLRPLLKTTRLLISIISNPSSGRAAQIHCHPAAPGNVAWGKAQGRNLCSTPSWEHYWIGQIMGKKAKKKEGPSKTDLALWWLSGTWWESAVLNAHQELPRWRFTHPKGTPLALAWHGITGGPVSAAPQVGRILIK